MDDVVTAAGDNTFTAASRSVVLVLGGSVVLVLVRSCRPPRSNAQPTAGSSTSKACPSSVRVTAAISSTALDTVVQAHLRRIRVVSDDSAGYRRSRLWLEAALRNTTIPLTDSRLTIAHKGAHQRHLGGLSGQYHPERRLDERGVHTTERRSPSRPGCSNSAGWLPLMSLRRRADVMNGSSGGLRSWGELPQAADDEEA